MAHRLFQQWLLQPLQKHSEITFRLNYIAFFAKNMAVRLIFNTILRKLPDLDLLLIKFFKVANGLKHKTSLADCYKLYLVVKEIKTLVGFLDVQATKNNNKVGISDQERNESVKGILHIKDLFQQLLDHFDKFTDLIESTIDLDKVETKREYYIHPGATFRLF